MLNFLSESENDGDKDNDGKADTGDKAEYQKFLAKAIAKFGGKGVDFGSVAKDKRDELGDYIDANWTADKEED